MMIVSAPGLSPDEISTLREEIEKGRKDPDHVIITNYKIYVCQ